MRRNSENRFSILIILMFSCLIDDATVITSDCGNQSFVHVQSISRFILGNMAHINKKAQLSLTNPRDACEKFALFT